MMANMGGTRRMLQQLFVEGGYLTAADADEVAETIELVTEYVGLGAMTRAHGDAIINQLAADKAEEYRERCALHWEQTMTTAGHTNRNQ